MSRGAGRVMSCACHAQARGVTLEERVSQPGLSLASSDHDRIPYVFKVPCLLSTPTPLAHVMSVCRNRRGLQSRHHDLRTCLHSHSVGSTLQRHGKAPQTGLCLAAITKTEERNIKLATQGNFEKSKSSQHVCMASLLATLTDLICQQVCVV
jgi:hypothetical protein